MVAETLIGILYNWVESSWQVSTVVIKYALAAFLIYELVNRKELVDIQEDFVFYGRYMVAAVVASGLVFSLTGVTVEPVIPYVGEFTALFFYGYLFWEY